jgi:diaminopimelate decarboxylase
MPDDSLRRLLAEFPTPLVAFDLSQLRAQVAVLREVLPPGSTLLYSLKANPLPPVVAALQRAGCGSEVSSPGELAVALGDAAGSGPLLYTGPGKSDGELAAAVAAGAVLSCESEVEVARVRDVVGPAAVMLRVQPDQRPAAGLSMADGRAFGLLPDDAARLCRSLPDGVEVVGFHCYVGSQLPDAGALLAGFGHALDTVLRIGEAGRVRPRIVDLGGGFPWPYAAPGAGPDLSPLGPALASLVAPVRAAGTALWFESGRGLVASAGRLLTTVRDVKRRGERTVVVVDAGVNVLGGMSALGRVLRPSTVLRNLTRPGAEAVTVDVVGPLCTPLDRLAVATAIAEPHPGDVLCIDNVGAYATTAALTAFLSRPAAVEVVTDGARVVEAWTLRTGHQPLGPAATRNPM